MPRVHRRLASTTHHTQKNIDTRVRTMGILFVATFVIIGVRLFIFMVLQNKFYTALASDSHEMSAQLFPERGGIFLESEDGSEVFPLAINRDLFFMYADTREIEDDDTAELVASKLSEYFHYDDEKKLSLYYQLNKRTDPYEPLGEEMEEEQKEQIDALALPGIAFVRRPHRFYPEGELASQVVGFLGKNTEGEDVGHYGIEGYWDTELMGSGGFLEGLRSAKGSWIPLAGRMLQQAEDGIDITLTIDRTLQFHACERLKDFQEYYEAEAGSLIIMDPHTGAIKVMCSTPDFDPNTYGKVDSVSVYNNATIFTPYEPGSVFKPIAMAGALNEGLVTPDTYFYDSGSAEVGCTKPIKNADFKAYGDQTMTGILENSINTGMVYVARQLGRQKFRDYIEQFGFGIKTGIELDTEMSGTDESLYRNEDRDFDCYTATASFGQGITATPLQLINAFGAIANGGTLMKPYIIKKIAYPNGKVEETKPKEIRQVIDKRAASLLTGMLVRVVDVGSARLARVPGYYIAGKTGTAQISGQGGYTSEYNHTFIGFGPVDDPKFVMLVKLEKPSLAYSSTTAAPAFADIAKFIFQYYHIPPSR